MRWGLEGTKKELAYDEIAPDLDFVKLQSDLEDAARLGNWGLAVSIGIMFGVLGAVFALDLSGYAFDIAMIVAAGLPFALVSFVTFRLSQQARTWETLNAIVHEEWKTGRSVLPAWFRIPGAFRRLRVVPEMTAGQVRRLRTAKLVLSDTFQIGVLLLVFLCFVVGMILLLNRSPVWLAFAILAGPAVPLVAFFLVAWPSVGLLKELREYEQVTGRAILPPGLAIERGMWLRASRKGNE